MVSTVSILYALLFYVATLLFVVGLALKIRKYARTPAPLKIPTTPAPTTQSGVALRMFREVAFFESLFKSNKWIWLFGYMFHVALALILLRHFRYFTTGWFWVDWVQPFGVYASFAFVLGLAGLWARRFVVERIPRQANDAEASRQTLVAAPFRPVECRSLRVGIDQGDGASASRPFAGEVQGERRLADTAFLIEERHDHDASPAPVRAGPLLETASSSRSENAVWRLRSSSFRPS